MRVADPKPGYCSACFNHPDGRYVDCEAAFDGAPVLHPDGTIAVLPWNGMQSSHDDLYLCEGCVQRACEILGFRPELHARQLAENRQLKADLGHWQETAQRLRRELDAQLSANLGEPAKSKRERVTA